LKECFGANFKDIEVVEISSHKKINGPTYCSLSIIKCPKLMFEEFQGGFNADKKSVLQKKNNLVVVKDDNIILNLDLEFERSTTKVVAHSFQHNDKIISIAKEDEYVTGIYDVYDRSTGYVKG